MAALGAKGPTFYGDISAFAKYLGKYLGYVVITVWTGSPLLAPCR